MANFLVIFLAGKTSFDYLDIDAILYWPFLRGTLPSCFFFLNSDFRDLPAATPVFNLNLSNLFQSSRSPHVSVHTGHIPFD